MRSRYITPSPGSGSTASGLTVALGEGLGANPPEAKVGGLAGGIVVPTLGAQLSPVVSDHGHQGQHHAHQDAEEGHTYLQCVRLGHGGRWCAQGDSRCGRRGMELSLGAGRGWAGWEQLPTPVRPQGGVSACAGLGFQGCSPLQPEIHWGAQSPTCFRAGRGVQGPWGTQALGPRGALQVRAGNRHISCCPIAHTGSAGLMGLVSGIISLLGCFSYP